MHREIRPSGFGAGDIRLYKLPDIRQNMQVSLLLLEKVFFKTDNDLVDCTKMYFSPNTNFQIARTSGHLSGIRISYEPFIRPVGYHGKFGRYPFHPYRRYLFPGPHRQHISICSPPFLYEISTQIQCCGAGAGGAEICWDLEPEPKLSFFEYFLQSAWRMLGWRKAHFYI